MSDNNQPTQKTDISGADLADLEDLAKEIHDMPEGEQKAIAKQTLQQLTNKVLETKQLPAQPLQIEKPLLHALDYFPGILRAGLGEAAVAAKHAYKGEPQEADVGQRLKEAINPFDSKMAESGAEINKRLGVEPSTTTFADTEAGKALGVPSDAWYNMSANTAKALPWDLLDPAMVKGALKMLSKSPAKLTAKEAEAELARQIEKSKSNGILSGALNLAVDPGEQLGNMGIRNRLANADKATRARGIRPFSDVYMENSSKLNPFKGVTSEGIQDATENMVSSIGDKKRAILEANPTAQKATLAQVMEPLSSSDFQEKMLTYGNTGAYQDAAANVRKSLEETAAARHPVAPSIYNSGNEGRVFGGVPEAISPKLSPMDLENMARTAQDKAAAARVYAKPGVVSVKNLTDLKMIPTNMAEGELQHAVGMQARDLQAGLLDAASPGAGGDVYRANKDLNTLLTGAPYIDRKFSRAGNSSSRSQDWLRGISEGKLRLAGDAILGAKDVGQMAASQALRSPWMRVGGIPAARAAWRDSFTQRQAEDPWLLLQPYVTQENQ